MLRLITSRGFECGQDDAYEHQKGKRARREEFLMRHHHNLLRYQEGHRHWEALTGLGLILIGSWISIGLEQHFVPHLLQDAVAYFLHGLGSAPIIAILLGEV